MGKTRAGGQSAPRFRRKRQEQRDAFFQTVANRISDVFDETDGVGILIGGTVSTAKQFVRGGHLDSRYQKHVVGTYPVEYATENGLEQLAEKIPESDRSVSGLVEDFYEAIRTDEAAYGHESIREVAEYGAVSDLIIVDGTNIDGEIIETVKEYGGEIHRVSPDAPNASRLAEGFGGIGAILRYPMK